MSTAKFDTRAKLREHLLGVTGLLAVAWEGQVYEPKTGLNNEPEPFIRETMLPADEELAANNELMALGIYQLDLFYPLGSRISTVETLADAIKKHFHPAQNLDFVSIDKARVGQGRIDQPWYVISVRIDYRSHAPNLQPQ